jgi:hypothetical protein
MFLRLLVVSSFLLSAAPPEREALLQRAVASFEENRGQFPSFERGSFVARTPGYGFVAAASGPVFLTPGGAVPFRLQGGAPWRAPKAAGRLIRESNYFLAGSRFTGIAHFDSVRYAGVYAGIDLVFKANGQEVEYDFVVAPYADPGQIAVMLKGAELRQRAPVAFQETGAGRVEIPVVARQEGDTIRFAVGPYDRALPLTIDPVVEASTLHGELFYESVVRHTVDPAGNFILVGRASDLPTAAGVYQRSAAGSGDAFVSKIAADGKTVLFTTYYGGPQEDAAADVALDAAGNIVIAGYGNCDQLPAVTGGYVTTGVIRGAFVAKFNPAGTQLLAASCFGDADGITQAKAIALDSSGEIYVGGFTTSRELPTTANAVRSTPVTRSPTNQAFGARLNAGATALVFLTYLGGGSRGQVNSIAIGPEGSPYFAGSIENSTSVDLYAPAGAYRSAPPSWNDGFVLQLNPTGTAIIGGSYLGGLGDDGVTGVALDAGGNILLTGSTKSSDFPVSPNSARPAIYNNETPAAFVMKLSPGGRGLVWSTLLGGSGESAGSAITANPDGKIYVTGYTWAGDFNTTSNALIPSPQPHAGGSAFLSQLDAAGNLLDSTYWKGTARGRSFFSAAGSRGLSIVSSGAGVVSVAGIAYGSTFPTIPGAVRTVITSSVNPDAFVTRFRYGSSCTFSVIPTAISAPIAGGRYRASVTTEAGCPWVHTASSRWIGTAAVGTDEVEITVDASDIPQRTGCVFVAGRVIAITQEAPCVYSNPNPVVQVPANGGEISFNLTSNLACPIAPATVAEWVDPTSLRTSIEGTTALTARIRTNHEPVARSATIQYAPGLSVRIDQAASTCTYDVSPLFVQLSAQLQSVAVSVQTQAGCAWQGDRLVEWLSPPTHHPSFPEVGPASTSFTAGLNVGPLRTGSVRIAGKTINVTQFGAPVGNGPTVFGTFRIPAGSPQRFAFGGRDLDGASDFNRMMFLVADAPVAAPNNSCYAYFVPAANELYLYNDDHTTVLGPITRGVAGSLENSFCRIDGATSTPYTASGSDGWLTLGVSLKGTFGASQHEVYGWIRDNAGNDTGWTRIDTWRVAPFSQIPAINAATRFAHAGNPKTLYGQATDGDGGANVSRVYFNIGASATPSATTCHGYVESGSQTAVLLDNSSANCAFSTIPAEIIPALNEANFRLSLSLKGALASGTHNVYFNARDAQANESGWVLAGTWAPANPPQLEANAPIGGSGFDKTFTLTFDHPEGFAQLGVVNVLINRFLDGDRACYIAFSQPLNVLYLVNDNGPSSGLSAGLVLGGTGSVANSQCRVNAAGSSAVRSGNRLTLQLNITFLSGFAGSRVVYLAAGAANGTNTGWRTSGIHEVPAAKSYPDAVGMSGAAGSGSGVFRDFVFEDAANGNNLQTAWVLIGSALDGRRACYVAYYRPGNVIYLTPDNGDAGQAQSTVLAGNNFLSNSQCRVEASGSSAVVSGNRLTLHLRIFFHREFAGPKVIWTAVSTLNNGPVSPWKASGAWTATQ